MTGTSQQRRKQPARNPIRLLLTRRRERYRPRTVLYQIPAVLDTRACIRAG